MIDKDMMEEVLRWMVARDGAMDDVEQVKEELAEASIDGDAIAYYMDVIPQDIMAATARMYGKGADPVDVVKVAMASTFTIAFEAGSRCRALDMERNG